MSDQDPRLAALLTDLAIAVFTDQSLKADLERLARVACRLVPTCSGASVSMLIEGDPTTVAVTDRVSLELDLAQYDSGEGPCLAALGGEAIRVGFIPQDQRFPHFAMGASDRRVLSVLSTPAMDHGAVIGSLNLYSRERDGFTSEDEDTALIIAAEVANALVRSSVITMARSTREMLQQQHDESVLVARAQGVLMAVNECSSAQAQELIRNAADQNGEGLIATAQRILSTVQSDSESRTTPD